MKMNNWYVNNILENQTRYLFVGGSRGSGKSHAFVQKFISRGINERGHRFLMLRKVRKDVKQSVYFLMLHYLYQYGIEKEVNKSDLIIKFLDNEFLFDGLENKTRIKSKEGITGAYLEELIEFTPDDLIEVDMITRAKTRHYYQICGAFNPDLQKGAWLKERYFDKVQPDVYTALVDYKINKFLPQKYIDILENLKDKNKALYQIYAKGQWALPDTLIYNNFKILELSKDVNDYDKIYGGIDFGYNNPAVFLLVGYRGKQIYIIDEIYQSELQFPDFKLMIYDKMKEYGLQKEEIRIICDSEDPGRIAELQSFGFDAISCRKGKGSVFAGIMLLKQIKQFIDIACTNYQKEIRAYSWEKKNGRILDKPVKFLDHAMDTMRMIHFTLFKQCGNNDMEIDVTSCGEYDTI